MTATSDLIQKLYIGYFGRAGDPEGLQYWVERSAAGMSDTAIAQSFSVQPEATAMYGFLAAPSLGLGQDAFLEAVYQNLFERSIETDGLNYWKGQLASGRPVGGIILDIINGAVGADATTVANKLSVANYYTEAVMDANAHWTLADDQADAIAVIANVTSTASTVTTGQALADSLVAADTATSGGVGAVSDGNAASDTVAEENAVVGAVVGVTASAIDPTSTDTVTYSLSTNPGNLFAIDATTGVVTLNGALDYETATSHSITVKATSSDGSSSTKDFTIAVSDVVEAQTFTLTANVDAGAAFTGGAGNDTFNAGLAQDPTTGQFTVETLSSLDYMRGGDGTADVLNIFSTDSSQAGYTVPTSVKVEGIEIANFRSEGKLTAVVSSWTGLTTLNSTYSDTEVNFTVGSGTDVNISGAAGSAVNVIGGATQTVTSGNAIDLSYSSGAVTVSGVTGDVNVKHGTTVSVTDVAWNNNTTIGAGGGTAVPTGAISVVDHYVGTGAIAVDGGSSVTITAGEMETGSAGVTVGAAKASTGAVSVTVVGKAYDGGQGNALGIVDVKGGTAVTVDVTATSSAAKAADLTQNQGTVTQGLISVTGDEHTTTVTVSQDADVAPVVASAAVAAVAGVHQVDQVDFVAMVANDTITVGGLTFTANTSLTAAQAAAAFANLTAGATHGSALAAQGSYSGTFAAYSTGAVTTANNVSSISATFAAAAAPANAIAVTDTAAAGNVASSVTTAGVAAAAAVAAVTGVLGVVAGTVTIDGATVPATDVLATVSIDGYGAGSTVKSDALTSLTLANSANDITITNAKATTLALGVDNITTGSKIDFDANTQSAYTTLNITTSGAASAFDLTAAKVTTLSIAGDQDLEITAASLAAVETVTVSGSVGLTLDASNLKTITSISTAATTGDSTITLDATAGSFTGGDGIDTITLSSTTVGKGMSIALGGGNETLTLAAGTTAITGSVDGGNGTDTLAMDAADAVTLSAADLSDNIAGFEKLSLGQVGSGASLTVDLANLDGISYVVSANTSSGGGTAPAFQQVIQDGNGNQQGGAAERHTLQFGNLNAGESYTVDGITVTAISAATAAEVAAAVDNAFGGQSSVPATMTVTGTQTGFQGGTWYSSNGVIGNNTVMLDSSIAGNHPDIVVTSAAAGPGAMTLDNMADNGTLELTDAGDGVTVTMDDATGAADRFNIITKLAAADLGFGTVDVAGVETVTITATDTAGAANTATLTVVDSSVKSITVTGNGNLDLTAAGAALKTVDASTLSGDLTFTSAVNSVTITGGAGDDLIAATGDTARLTGGAGADVFDISNATSSVQTYATITDLAAGDGIKFLAATAFNATAITLADTASFTDYANEAIIQSDDAELSWFQYGGNTYVVEDVAIGQGDTEVTFTNGSDVIVRITGLVDLSDSAFGANTLYVV